MKIPLLLAVIIAIFGQGSAFSVPFLQDQQNPYENDDSSEETYTASYQHDESSASYQKNDNILYPFGEEYGDQTTPVEDDGCSPQQHLQQEFMFFEKSYKCLYVCNNGVISFNDAVSQYTPDPFPVLGPVKIIAPYWADVDNELGGLVYFRETQDPSILQKITADMGRHLPNLHYVAKWAYIATWHEVVFYGAAVKKRNTFQAVLTSDGFQYFVIMNYKNIQWTTGTASEGDPHTGMGGTQAQAGFNTGDNVHYFNIPGSRTNEVLKVVSTSNVNHPGRWIFEVNRFKAPGGCIFQAKFASEGVPFWKDSTCSTKCLCRDNKVTCLDETCPSSSTCEQSGSFFTCQIIEQPQLVEEPQQSTDEPQQSSNEQQQNSCS
ncbi:alpha-tectorin-like [Pyxicephalus adspersus]|uniref:alpha-tectorin-like n=1 Tax=Pyxicephalus adspersus TaxID=30357 RepID=UPI003B5A05A1